MYKVYCDGYRIYDALYEDYKIFNATVELELNKTGSFTFDIYPEHPNYAVLCKLKSEITVWQDNLLIFRGRILNEEQGFYNQRQVVCEGELAFLLDSIMRPYGSETEPWRGTPEEYLTMLINNHNTQMRLAGENDKTFRVGLVKVTDGDTSNDDNLITRYDTDFQRTWDLISEKLVGSLGGYLWARHEVEDGKIVTYIDYLTADDLPQYSNQAIVFGVNLLDLKKTTKGEEVMTAIIPLGKKESDTYVTINGAKDASGNVVCDTDYLIDTNAAKLLGVIFKTVQFADITEPYNLWKVAKEYLESAVKFPTSIELTAADLSGITDNDPFHLGQKILIKDKYHGLDEIADGSFDEYEFIVQKLSLPILQPSNRTLTVGATFLTFTERANQSVAAQNKLGAQVNSAAKSAANNAVAGQLKNYYTKEETDASLSNTNTALDDTNTALDNTNTELSNTKTQVNEQIQSLLSQIQDLKARVDLLHPEDSGDSTT